MYGCHCGSEPAGLSLKDSYPCLGEYGGLPHGCTAVYMHVYHAQIDLSNTSTLVYCLCVHVQPGGLEESLLGTQMSLQNTLTRRCLAEGSKLLFVADVMAALKK